MNINLSIQQVAAQERTDRYVKEMKQSCPNLTDEQLIEITISTTINNGLVAVIVDCITLAIKESLKRSEKQEEESKEKEMVVME